MKINTYTQGDYYKARCAICSWITQIPLKSSKGTACPLCSSKDTYTFFPGTESQHILGGLVHFIDSYNQKITGPRHIFPPHVYVPIIFACSNYETLIHDLVAEIMNKYGQYIGRLGKRIVFDEVLSRYDRKANENLFKMMTGISLQESVQDDYGDFFHRLEDLYKVRNKVMHGKKISDSQQALKYVNEGVAILLLSVEVFTHLTNSYVHKLEKTVDVMKILRLGSGYTFQP